MATTLAPFGLRYVGRLSGAPLTQGFTKYPIANNYATPIMNGDPVLMLNTGAGRGRVNRMNATVAATTVTDSGTWLGVFQGCEYTDPSSQQFLQRHYYPGSIAKNDIAGFIVDDPFGVFEIQADATLGYNELGCNFAVIQTALGNTTTGNSGLALQASSHEQTATLPLRLVGFRSADEVDSTYPICRVKFNTHFLTQTLGTDDA